MERKRGERGQALVEMALVLPLLLMLLFGIIEFGRIFHAYLTVNNGAREGARLAVVGAQDTAIIARIKDTAVGLDSSKLQITIAPAYSNRLRGQPVTVQVSYPVQIFAPIIGEIIGNPYTVSGSVQMRME
ncbi:MAG: TadE/TadG family type IV pilus assembly protein [Bacillota bacterium]